ncbi:twin-arginine translocase TatA/TatE family subunit [Paraurantiacibacter namhicola]|uniref:Sec-independent protein translocase protein TatA n=1 Tax=Paraurantiacibacter namhicola TaxID=645517 RepID=A0A1C7DAW1_9SPHN|nr:twin-arginine translocase TatA/TatE family subunit [Paraurantiacibacter namhicola]ANU08584.1 twin arginine translocase protein A [Paraurantiacibacter namhicola]
MGIGWPQLIIVAILVLVLFGRGRISEMMGDFGKGISSFKKGMKEEEAGGSSDKPDSARIEGPHHEAKPASQAAADPQPAADKTTES